MAVGSICAITIAVIGVIVGTAGIAKIEAMTTGADMTVTMVADVITMIGIEMDGAMAAGMIADTAMAKTEILPALINR